VTRRFVFRRPAANRDIRNAAHAIAENNPRAAIRFVEAVQATEELLLAAPGVGTHRDYGNPSLTGMRWHSVRGFRKYLVFYIPRSDGIEVVRVLHGARNLGTLFRS
jgi:toxin ParE1/3/4